MQNSPVWQEHTARWTHITFYVLIFGMVLSGVGMMVLSGAGPVIFGQSTAELPRLTDYPLHRLHGVGALVLAAMLACHVSAAMHHHFIRRDGMLRRMWYCGDHH
ncbi:cytochrome b/b6 domain-containing protein [Ralstonia solanacearum]|uniref:Cytochrome b/b6 domain-containing protein n=1 Tax=Ralstonia solanacearum TaxID=305 RepID=A0AAW5ZUV5_RALSL|nr:cytochrome b/b6 domain-containing protein [Ralstonia solanacearum]